jgi:hypothetical protein
MAGRAFPFAIMRANFKAALSALKEFFRCWKVTRHWRQRVVTAEDDRGCVNANRPLSGERWR